MLTKTCMVTGHRDIPKEKTEFVKRELRREILQAIKEGYTHFVSGFADGVDLLFASIIAELKLGNGALKLEAAIPYRNRMKNPNRVFQELVNSCDVVGVHSEEYTPDCFFERNRFMVAHSQRVIAVYDGRKRGGTSSTILYAHSQERELRIIAI